ncbi:DUF2208 domain-containing protein [Thermogladius sp. 4427co]|uniref:DUF2208 domain-containing protein n=1 Tax=Thermogladius sp. 4427co TaxID=3450718 RepID=UPI003F795FD2
MMQQPKRHVTVLMNAISIIVISLLSAIVPQWSWLIFLAFYLVFFYLVYRFTVKTSKTPPPSELGSPLFKEPNAIKIAVSDPGLNKDLSSQFKVLFITLLISMLAILLYPLYIGLIGGVVYASIESVVANQILARFSNYVIMYTFIIVVLYSIRWFIMRRVEYTNLLIPHNYVLYRKGIVINGRSFIPVGSSICFTVNKQRRFIEFYDPTNKSSKIRLYTETPSTFYEKLLEVGFNECKA